MSKYDQKHHVCQKEQGSVFPAENLIENFENLIIKPEWNIGSLHVDLVYRNGIYGTNSYLVQLADNLPEF